MRLALIIVLSVSLLAFVVMYFTADRVPQSTNIDLPWQVEILDERRSKIFGTVLNETRLEQARNNYGQLEGLGLYRDPAGAYSLEAYFGKITTGPFSAKLIATLDVSQPELESLVTHTVKRVATDNGSLKWTLNQQKQAEQGLRAIKSLSFIPGYKGMDQAFIEGRFGAPAKRETIDETAELWFYPQIGVRVLLDSDGNEMFEYLSLSDFEKVYGGN